MGVTPDRFPGDREEEVIELIDDGSGDPTIDGQIKYVSGSFRMRDSIGIHNSRSSSDVDDILIDENSEVIVDDVAGNVLINQ